MAVADGIDLSIARREWSTSAPGASPAVRMQGPFNITLWGTFTGLSATLQRSFDAGTTWVDCTNGGLAFTRTGPASETWQEPEAGVLYRVNVTAIASGTVNVRLSK
jgi:hypothetical protein